MHDAPLVGSTEDEWTILQLGFAFDCAFDGSEPIDAPAELRPEAIFKRRTLSQSSYYVMVFSRFAQDFLLEYHVRTGYSKRNSSYLCSYVGRSGSRMRLSAFGKHILLLVMSTYACLALGWSFLLHGAVH